MFCPKTLLFFVLAALSVQPEPVLALNSLYTHMVVGTMHDM